MIVISDTTPLISLMKADQLDLLGKLYQEILIPKAVYNELTSSIAFQNEANAITHSHFIKVVEVKERLAVDVLQRATGLDIGESEAIVYAEAVKADSLLMDETAGRKVAKSLGIHIVGTVGILLGGFDEGYLSADDVEAAVDALQKTKRWISNDLIDHILKYIRK